MQRTVYDAEIVASKPPKRLLTALAASYPAKDHTVTTARVPKSKPARYRVVVQRKPARAPAVITGARGPRR